MYEAAENFEMMSRGTDHATEERRLRTREEKEGIEEWTESFFFAVGEVTFLCVPAFYVLMDAEPNGPLKFSALFGWLALCLSVGTFRGHWIDIDWPQVTPALVLLRFVFYDAVILGVAYAATGVDIAFHSPVVTATTAVVLAVGCALLFSRLGGAVENRL
ncbi:hypothetical protein A4G99_10395 [Haladaptatus sp. R4]|nr:hypothetical protein A4G99_10395 [Haladaptatus sp. R4]